MRFTLQSAMLIPFVTSFHRMQPYQHRISPFLQDVAKGNTGKNPNLLQEELGELTVGIKEFQTDAFEQLYNKSLNWSTSFAKKSQVPLPKAEPTSATTTDSTDNNLAKSEIFTINATVSSSQLAKPSAPLEVSNTPNKAVSKSASIASTPTESLVYKAQPGIIVNEIAQPTTEIEFARLNSIPIVPTVEPKVKSVPKSVAKASAEPLFNSVFDVFKSIDVSSPTKKGRAQQDQRPAPVTKMPASGGMFSFLNPSPGFDKPTGSVVPAPNKLKQALFSAPPASETAPKAASRPESAASSTAATAAALAVVNEDYVPPVVKVMRPTATPNKVADGGLSSVFGFLQPKTSTAPLSPPARQSSPAKTTLTAAPAATTPPLPPRPVAPVRTAPAPAVRASPLPTGRTVAPVSSNQGQKQSGGFLSTFGATLSRSAPEKTVGPAKVAPVQNKSSAVQAAVAPTSTAPGKPTAPASAPPTRKSSSSSNLAPTANPVASFFSFLKAPAPTPNAVAQKKSANEKSPPPAVVVAPKAPSLPPAQPAKAFSLFPKPQAAKVAAVPPPAKTPQAGQPKPLTPPAPSPVTKGLLSFGLPSFGAVKSTVSSAPQAVAAPASGMSETFRSTVSRLLKGDAAKINAVQKSTDSFRAGSITTQAYVAKLSQLFGNDLPDSITKPLVSEIPEKDLGKKLSAEFARVQSARQAQPKKSSSFFSFSLFGGGGGGEGNGRGSVEPPATRAAAVLTAAPIKSKTATSSVPAPKQSAAQVAPAAKATAAPRAGAGSGTGSGLQVPDQVPIAKKAFVEAQLKSVASGGADVRAFYSALERELGRTKLRVILPALMAQLPRDKAAQLQAIDAGAPK